MTPLLLFSFDPPASETRAPTAQCAPAPEVDSESNFDSVWHPQQAALATMGDARRMGHGELEAVTAAAVQADTDAVAGELPKRKPGKRTPVEPGDHITPGQRRALNWYGIPEVPGMSRETATRLIGYEKICEKHGLCNWRQREWLDRVLGVSARGMDKATGYKLAMEYRSGQWERSPGSDG